MRFFFNYDTATSDWDQHREKVESCAYVMLYKREAPIIYLNYFYLAKLNEVFILRTINVTVNETVNHLPYFCNKLV